MAFKKRPAKIHTAHSNNKSGWVVARYLKRIRVTVKMSCQVYAHYLSSKRFTSLIIISFSNAQIFMKKKETVKIVVGYLDSLMLLGI